MKKTLLVLAVLFISATASFAQTNPDSVKKDKPNPIQMSMGLDAGTAAGSTRDLYTSTIGASFKFEFPFDNKGLNLVLTAAYSNYTLKSTPLSDSLQNGHFIPVTVGLKYYVYKTLYIEGNIGESFNINTNYLGYQTGFFYSPVIGVSLPVQNNTAAVDISLRYESSNDQDSKVSQFALGVAYRFRL